MADNPASHRASDTPKEGSETSAADVERANRVLAEQAGLRDGPNAGPSPQEHLAAQGRARSVEPSVGTKAGARPANEPPLDVNPEVSPEEEELVDEQINRDRQTSKKTDPSAP